MHILLVPSNDIKPTDSLENTRTLERCKQALQLWQSGQYDVMVLSGGKVYAPKFQTRPLANTMFEWMIQQPGAPSADKILIANTARDTIEDISATLTLIQKHFPHQEVDHITVATDWLHGKRFVTSLKRGFGINNVTIANTNYPLPFDYFLTGLIFLPIPFFDPTGQSWLVKLARRKRTR